MSLTLKESFRELNLDPSLYNEDSGEAFSHSQPRWQAREQAHRQELVDASMSWEYGEPASLESCRAPSPTFQAFQSARATTNDVIATDGDGKVDVAVCSSEAEGTYSAKHTRPSSLETDACASACPVAWQHPQGREMKAVCIDHWNVAARSIARAELTSSRGVIILLTHDGSLGGSMALCLGYLQCTCPTAYQARADHGHPLFPNLTTVTACIHGVDLQDLHTRP
ncbi:hypothetical protein EXIGLDRAFT_840182 [Exidia glandulosa HHB12029]|uniref:Uncharacterized protein n=1 Tax=Exidia glandulosa HHB12029 TaxID=1314781 RepID=A0A165EL11_EXIGL|nr:hypothetical protein EXIGLDRAFT_840182 [Exidia glandulosa HHB12029]